MILDPSITITVEQANTIREALSDYDFLMSITSPRLQLSPDELAVMAYLNKCVPEAGSVGTSSRLASWFGKERA